MANPNNSRIVIHRDRSAGHHFNGQADLTVSFHCERVDSSGEVLERGFFCVRKWLSSRAAFNYDPNLGWAKEHWFRWSVEVRDDENA